MSFICKLLIKNKNKIYEITTYIALWALFFIFYFFGFTMPYLQFLRLFICSFILAIPPRSSSLSTFKPYPYLITILKGWALDTCVIFALYYNQLKIQTIDIICVHALCAFKLVSDCHLGFETSQNIPHTFKKVSHYPFRQYYRHSVTCFGPHFILILNIGE